MKKKMQLPTLHNSSVVARLLPMAVKRVELCKTFIFIWLFIFNQIKKKKRSTSAFFVSGKGLVQPDMNPHQNQHFFKIFHHFQDYFIMNFWHFRIT